MRRLVLAMVLLVLLAGCTSPLSGDGNNGNGDTTPPARGLLIEELAYEQKSIRPGQTARLILRVANTNPTDITGISANLSNFGDLIKTKTESSCEGTISGLTRDQTDAVTEVCAWELDASNVDVEEGSQRFPVTLTLEYTGSLTMQEGSLQFTFLEDASPRSKETSVSNGEISIGVSYEPEQLPSTDSLEMGVSASNVGNGRVVDKEISIGYGGSMTDLFDFNPGDHPCRTLYFRENERSTSADCEFLKGSSAPGSRFTGGASSRLRINADYTYQRIRQVPLTVTE